MRYLFVNKIRQVNGITIGIVGLNETVLENLEIIYEPSHLNNLRKIMSDNKENGCHWFDRYCQYVILVNFQPSAGLSMKISDYGGNVDKALDEYINLSAKEWSKDDRDKIMELFQKIENDKNKELAEMIIKNRVP